MARSCSSGGPTIAGPWCWVRCTPTTVPSMCPLMARRFPFITTRSSCAEISAIRLLSRK
ncbi:unnamed protein product [Oppiella nova]|uniref:Uncharacterized protein n=1 Tax=Oppiella nova TaxID=334625 RepID=A0A7R9MM39_9ACAR|nr:unnamed protein product [Oppiella nova]CAG2179932.1 unnamed protein product [Oppiella nova]